MPFFLKERVMKEEDALEAIVSKAIFESLDQKKRDELVQRAIENLFRVSDPKEPNQIQLAFYLAVNKIAHKRVMELMEEDGDLVKRIREIIDLAAQRAFTQETREKIAENITNAITMSFKVPHRSAW